MKSLYSFIGLIALCSLISVSCLSAPAVQGEPNTAANQSAEDSDSSTSASSEAPASGATDTAAAGTQPVAPSSPTLAPIPEGLGISREPETTVPSEQPKLVVQPTASPAAVAAAPARPAPRATPQPAANAAPRPTPAPTARPISRLGEIVYLEGDVRVRRGEAVLQEPVVDFGFEIAPWDLLSTGAASFVEIDVNAAWSGGSIIKISENTAYWFDVEESGTRSTSSDIKLLAGSIAMKVQRLSGTSQVNVQVAGSSFGVRGTEFMVSLGVDGSILVTCLEGKVECRDEQGAIAYAVPNTVVEQVQGGAIAARQVPVEVMGEYRKSWLDEKLQLFLANPSIYAASWLGQSQKWGGAVDEASRKLAQHTAIWNRWREAMDSGRSYSFVELGADKKLVNEALFQAAKALFFYESAHYRLLDMAVSLRDAGQELPVEFEQMWPVLSARERDLAYIRSIFALYGDVSEGSPLGEFFSERAFGASSGLW